MSSKIIQLTSENVKRLVAVNIKPNGNLVIIGGKNGAGKSSVLDSICYALGGKDELPEVPIRKGAEKAKVVVDLDDLVIKRTFTAAGGTTLSVENKEGAKYPSPQAILDKLASKVTFDPLAFLRLEAFDQVVKLRKLVALDTSALDTERTRIYAERTILNRQVEQKEALLKSFTRYEDAPKEPSESKPILDKIAAITNHNRRRGELNAQVNIAEERFLASNREVELARKALANAEKMNGDLKADADKKRESLLPYLETQDDSALRKELEAVEATNKKVQSNQNYDQRATELASAKVVVNAVTKRIQEIDAEKLKKVSEIKYPIEGLSISDAGTVTFEGLPLAQASQAAQMRISVAIAAAMNPKLRVMLIRDGSLVDEEGLALLEGLAKEFDLQIWIERVGKKDKCAVIIENGQVEGAEVQTPAPASATELKLA